MSNQAIFLGKSHFTDTANVRLFPKVQFFVPGQVVFPCKAPLTGMADMGLLACVHHLVHYQVHFLGEASPTVTAHIRLFTRVQSHVHSQVSCLNEALLTNITDMQFFTGVQFPVVDKTSFPSKPFLTDFARVRLFAAAHSGLHKTKFLTEGRLEGVAGVRVLASIQTLMNGAGSLRKVLLQTGWAGIKLPSEVDPLIIVGELPCVASVSTAEADVISLQFRCILRCVVRSILCSGESLEGGAGPGIVYLIV